MAWQVYPPGRFGVLHEVPPALRARAPAVPLPEGNAAWPARAAPTALRSPPARTDRVAPHRGEGGRAAPPPARRGIAGDRPGGDAGRAALVPVSLPRAAVCGRAPSIETLRLRRRLQEGMGEGDGTGGGAGRGQGRRGLPSPPPPRPAGRRAT